MATANIWVGDLLYIYRPLYWKHLLILATIQSANHVAAAVNTDHTDQALQLFTSNIVLGEKCDLSDFEHGMVVGAR